jgi:hypothetical protein
VLLASQVGHAAQGSWPFDPSVNKSDISLSYDVTLTNSLDSGIYDILTFNQYTTGSGAWWPSALGSWGGTINDPNQKSTTNMPLSGLMVGLANDAEGGAHVVMMISNSAAGTYAGQEFEALFPNRTEAELIGDLRLTMETDRNTLDASGQTLWDDALNRIWFDFALGEAQAAWFALGDLPYGSNSGTIVTSQFTVMEWSAAQAIGTGTANLQYTGAPVPLPPAILLLGSGVAGLAGFRKRVKRS